MGVGDSVGWGVGDRVGRCIGGELYIGVSVAFENGDRG